MKNKKWCLLGILVVLSLIMTSIIQVFALEIEFNDDDLASRTTIRHGSGVDTIILDEEMAALFDYSLEITINYMGTYASMKTNELRQIDISQIDQLMEDLQLPYDNQITYSIYYNYVRGRIISFCYTEDVVILGIGGDESAAELTISPDVSELIAAIYEDESLTDEEIFEAFKSTIMTTLFGPSYSSIGSVTLNFTHEESLYNIMKYYALEAIEEINS